MASPRRTPRKQQPSVAATFPQTKNVRSRRTSPSPQQLRSRSQGSNGSPAQTGTPPSTQPAMEKLRTELRSMFQELTQQLLTTVQRTQLEDHTQPEQVPEDTQDIELHWATIMEDLPTAPVVPETSWFKIFKLAKELKRRATLTTAGRDMHDIHTVLFFCRRTMAWPTSSSHKLHSSPTMATLYCRY